VDDLLGALQQVLDCPQEQAVMARNAAGPYQREVVAERVYDERAAYLEEMVWEPGRALG
jgi:hypothetical protein